MWRIRSLVILGVMVGALILGATVAQGAWYWNAWYWNAWYWNAEGSGDGVDFRTAWTVVPAGSDESIDGDELNYHATIQVRVPKEADFSIVEQAGTETATLKRVGNLDCKADGIEAEVIYRVEPLEGAQGDLVKVWVTADGHLLDEETGPLDKRIKLETFIPSPEGVTPSCYSGG